VKVQASAPSNIALVKYWGKKGNQLPLNPSLSFCLKNSKSIFDLELSKSDTFSFDFSFEGKPKPSFHPKLEKFFETVLKDLPYLNSYHLKIASMNTFPHSTGIASSASSFAALSLGLIGLEYMLKNQQGAAGKFDNGLAFSRASEMARIGSGSACRSLFAGFNSWGKDSELKATPIGNVHSKFQSLQDYILIVDEGAKAVSSSQGHALMNEHFYKERRIEEANFHYDRLSKALLTGDIDTFCEVSIAEAMSLHALMMTSKPSFLLMKPLSLAILEKLFDFYSKREIPFTFTLDAGPNIHLIFFKEDQALMEKFIQTQIQPLLKGNQIIKDEIGEGAKILWK
jgi:diphosphomevalonate decarboxylase